MGLTGGFLDGVPPEGVREALKRARAAVQRECPQVRMNRPMNTPRLPGEAFIEDLDTAVRLRPRCVPCVADQYLRLVSSRSAYSATGQVIADIEASGKLSEDQRAEIAQAFKRLALQAAQ